MEENDEFSDNPNNPNATRNRIVGRIVRGHFVLSPDGERVRVRGCHSELYKANRRSEVRTSEPVCRADSESHSWTNCEEQNNLKPSILAG